MPKKVYDLKVATSSYTGKDGKEHKNWEDIGAVMQDDNGGKYIILKTTFNPAGVPRKEGTASITVRLFPLKDNTQQGSNSQAYSTPPNEWKFYSQNNSNNNNNEENNGMPF